MNERCQKTESLQEQTRRLLKQFDLRVKKGLGQHFLIDRSALQASIEAADLNHSDIAIEIGPGMGVLTQELAKQAGWVIAIELDTKMVEMLRATLSPYSNVSIINADVLRTDPQALIHGEKGKFSPDTINSLKYKVVANLPYYITQPTIRHFCESSFKPQKMVIMVQKEVARVITAKPGDMSILSIAVQFYGKPEIVKYIPAQCFYPAPKVDSAILKIDMYNQTPVPVTDEKTFFKLVRAGFCAARKQIANSLAQGLRLPKSEVTSRLEQANITPQRRAESLSLEEWARLWQIFYREEGHSADNHCAS